MSRFWDKVKTFLGMEISLTDEPVVEQVAEEKPKRKRAPAKRKTTRKRKPAAKKPRTRKKKTVKEEVTEFEKPIEAEVAAVNTEDESVQVVESFQDTTFLTDSDKDDKVS